MNRYWLRKAEKDIRVAFPDADLMFDEFDCGRELGVCARVNNYRRAIRLGSDDAWVEKTKTLIEETTKGPPSADN